MKTKNKHTILLGILITAGLFLDFSSKALASPKNAYPSCGDYDYEIPAGVGGSVTVSFTPPCTWTLTAVPNEGAGWRFLYWEDNCHLTNPVRVIDFDSEVDLDLDTLNFTAVFASEAPAEGTIRDYDIEVTPSTDSEKGMGTISYEYSLTGDTIILTPRPAVDYVFAQWSDGNAENPRYITDYSQDTISYYATFIPDSTKGKIDFWRKDGIVITTESGDYLEDGDYGAVTVFYDGQLVFCGLPDYEAAIEIEPRAYYFGVYYLPATYSDVLAGKECHIVFKDDGFIPVATLDAVIPVLVDDTMKVDVTLIDTYTGVHVLDGGVATLSGTHSIGELDIYPGGKAIIDGTIAVDAVTMRADAMTCLNENGPYANVYQMPHPELLVTGKLDNEDAQIINYEYVIDLNAYYTFGLPYPVNTANVMYRSGAPAYRHFVLGQYYGDLRAAGYSGWNIHNSYFDLIGNEEEGYNYTDHVDINPGVGHYIYAEPQEWAEEPQEGYGAVIRFPMEVDRSAGPESVRPIPVYPHVHEGGYKEDKNFNLICLPYLTSYDGSFTLSSGGSPVLDEEGNPKTLRYIVAPNPFFKDYDIQMVGTVPVYPFHAYFVQFDGDVDELELESPNPAARASAPRRSKAKATTKKELMAGITLSQSGKSDHTGLLIGEHFTEGYDVDADFVMMMGESERVRVFSLQGNKQLTYIALPPANGSGVLETTIPLGYSRAVVGSEMTFAIDDYRYPQLREDEDISALYLIDNIEGVTVNLLEEPYTCTAIQVADNERFSLGIHYTYKAPQITTDICATPAEINMRDGIYDLLGRLISTDKHISHPGVYIVIENGKARKEVIR